jgi:hypothetical protein
MDEGGKHAVIHARIEIEAEMDARSEARLPVSAAVPLRELGQNAVEAKLLNISSRGFMVETEALIETGSRVWLTLPGVGRVNGLVLWALGGRIGGELAEPVDPLNVLQAAGEGGA